MTMIARSSDAFKTLERLHDLGAAIDSLVAFLALLFDDILRCARHEVGIAEFGIDAFDVAIRPGKIEKLATRLPPKVASDISSNTMESLNRLMLTPALVARPG